MRTKTAQGFRFDARAAVIPLLLAPWLAVCAQAAHVHEQAFDWYVMRSSIVSATSLSAASAHAYGVQRATDVAVLRVAVMRRSGRPPEPLPAKVQAVSLNLARQRQAIEMREDKSGGAPAYYGSFRFAPGELRTFLIRAEPLGSEEVLEMAFDEMPSGPGGTPRSARHGTPIAADGDVGRPGGAGQENK